MSLTDNSPVGRCDDLLGAGGQLYPGLLGLWVVRDDGGVVSRSTGELAPVSRLLLHTANDGTLRHCSDGQDIADVQLSCGSESGQTLTAGSRSV